MHFSITYLLFGLVEFVDNLVSARLSVIIVTLSFATALCRNRTLVTLELGTNGLTDVSAQLLGDTLKLNFRLQGLSLWQNEITGQGALLWLGLGSNRIGTEGTWALSESLKSNVTLLWLGLGGNELGDRGALHLATLVQSETTMHCVIVCMDVLYFIS